MSIWSGKVHSYLPSTVVAGAIFVVAACSSDVTAPAQLTVSITSLQDTMSIGALKYTGTVAIGDSTIQVAVKVKNDSTAAVSYTGGCIRNVGLALYANASLVGSPVVALQQPDPICLALVDGTLVPGDSTVFTGTFPLSQLNKVAAGTYYVAAPLTNVNFDGDSVQVKAGTLLTSN